MSPAPALIQTISHQDLWLSRGRTTPDSSHRNYLYLSVRFLLSDCTNYRTLTDKSCGHPVNNTRRALLGSNGGCFSTPESQTRQCLR
ncbi:hypothetical protein AOLI_G00022440 [Acnodon oligacanthus]